MLYYCAKIAQAAGLGIIAINFAAAFPNLMSMRAFSLGAIVFVFGWIIEHYLLRK